MGCRGEDITIPDTGAGRAGSGAVGAGSSGRVGSGGASGNGGRSATTGGAAGTTGGTGNGGTASSTGGSAGTGALAGSGGVSTGGGAGAGGTLGGSGGVSSGGAGGSTGGIGGMSSGGASSGGMPGKTCVDVEPPPDPNWPGATCDNWANETTSCTESWFSTYCDVSCGRCVPEGGAGTGGMAGVDCSTQGLPNVTGGNGYATRYWDCCQTHCSQFDNRRCGQDGVQSTGDTNSACNGGGSFACYNQAPHAVSDCLSYGYIAKANPNCGGCYRIQFTGEGEYNANDAGSKLIKGKQMIVKVSNTGGDVAGNQFDMMIPGGGVGQFNACSRQWGTSDLGAQYGGFLTECTGTLAAKKECVRTECMKIPSGPARDGCIWFVDWFQAADNPKFTSQATDCPF